MLVGLFVGGKVENLQLKVYNNTSYSRDTGYGSDIIDSIDSNLSSVCQDTFSKK